MLAKCNRIASISDSNLLFNAVLYLVGVDPKDNSIHEANPCPLCARSIIQAGINNVYLRVGEGAENYIAVPAKELVWVQSWEN